MANLDRQALLTIGEFSSATQLSPKALRLYDDESVLRPAEVNATNGYRYYSREQIPTARLIRILREMEVPLPTIATIVGASRVRADALLSAAGRDLDRRYARQKRAFQMGLALLHRTEPRGEPKVDSIVRPASTVLVCPFYASRENFLQQLRQARTSAVETASTARLHVCGPPIVRLIEPFSDEDARLELALPVDSAQQSALSLQTVPAARCVAHSIAVGDGFGAAVEAALDGLFDWLDKNGLQAREHPALAVSEFEGGSIANISWAYEYCGD